MKVRHLCAGLALAATLLLAPAATAGAQGEPRDQVFTLWWVVFNHPEECATSPCSLDDLEDPDVEPSIIYASGQVVGQPGDLRLITALYETGPGFADLDSNTSLIGGPGLLDSRAAEIHFVVRSHGPVTDGITLDQLTLYLDPGCQDVGGPNVCLDRQVTVHQPTDEDVTVSDVLWFDDLSVVPGARSRLVRLDGGVKMMLETSVLPR